MTLQYRIISMGALGRNRLWNETDARRLSHATTTLVRDATTTILVDPGLPAELLVQRLDERTGLAPDQIDVVFLTTFRPVHRRSLTLFGRASWLMHEPEITAMRGYLDEMTDHVETGREQDVERILREERAMLERIKPANDKLTRQVHLFPAAGVTPGSAALLLAMPTRTTVVAGDAVLTQDHYEAGRVFEQSADLDRAQEAFAEIVEIADEIVPGHDNVFVVTGR